MIAILDYGLGNIRAFENIYKRLGMPCCLARTADQLAQADKIILPGVGAFDHAMTALEQSGLRRLLEHRVLSDKVPVLGVCVGMQIMADASEEGVLPGLGWIGGRVKRFDSDALKSYQPLPHMGWNNLCQNRASPLLEQLSDDEPFYFLHSYHMTCHDQANVLAVSDYGGCFHSMVQRENVYGIQCHPEKSHQAGVSVLENFGKLAC